jgi:ATP-dependent Clp protease ATP-binding subunit ClpC
MEKHSVSKLVGSPPGYVGFEEGGQLTEKVRRKQYSVVLFDEIEKAHPDVFNLLLQILEEGRLTDSKGRAVDFKNTIIILTSNVGARQITEPKRVGFASKDGEVAKNYDDMKSNVMGELKNTFRPEFLNRIDDIIVFHPLTQDNIKEIVGYMLEGLTKRIGQREIRLEVTEDAKEFLAKKGYDPLYGARPLRRFIQTLVEDKLAEEMLEGRIKEGDVALVKLEDEKIIVNKKINVNIIQSLAVSEFRNQFQKNASLMGYKTKSFTKSIRMIIILILVLYLSYVVFSNLDGFLAKFF